MGGNIIEPRQTCIQSNAEPDAKPAVAVVSGSGEAIRQKGRSGGRAVCSHLLRDLQKIGKEEGCSDIEKREEPSSSKSRKPLERGGGNRKNRKDIRRPSHGPQERDRTGSRCDK
jgi:hypothetical protein